MAPTSFVLKVSKQETAGYRPISPYCDDETSFANNLLCPRYAENDPTSAPPSPTSYESFDVLDSIPWRRSYIGLDNTTEPGLQHRLTKKHRATLIALLFLLVLLLAGCGVSGYLAVKQQKDKPRRT